jgi:hypothetical protein
VFVTVFYLFLEATKQTAPMPINDENISSDDTPKEKVKKKSKFS